MANDNGAVYIHESDEGVVYIKLSSIINMVEMPDENTPNIIALYITQELSPNPLVLKFSDDDIGDHKRNKLIESWIEVQNTELYGILEEE